MKWPEGLGRTWHACTLNTMLKIQRWMCQKWIPGCWCRPAMILHDLIMGQLSVVFLRWAARKGLGSANLQLSHVQVTLNWLLVRKQKKNEQNWYLRHNSMMMMHWNFVYFLFTYNSRINLIFGIGQHIFFLF